MKSWKDSCIRSKLPGRPGEHKTALFFIILFVLTIAAAIASLCLGSASSASVSPWEALHLLFSGDAAETTVRIVRIVRLPRTLGALLAGSAIAVSGAVLQTILANPLVSPGIIGIHAGAGLFAVLALAFMTPAMASAAMPFAAFAGALCAALIVVLIAKKAGASRMTIVLGGIAVSYILSGIMDYILTLVPDALGGYTNFRVGSLAGITLVRLRLPAIFIAAALVLTLLLTNELDVLGLGDETATGLGLNVPRTRLIFLILSAALSGAAVSFAGMISFVGLVVPHICRRFIGAESRKFIPACILSGAFFLNLCDLAGRLIARPYEIPVGIILSLTGGPFFLVLIFRRHRKG